MIDERADTNPIILNIAGFVLDLETDEPLVGDRIRSRYRDFLSTDIATDLSIRIKIIPEAQFIEPKPGPWIIETTYKDNSLVYQSYFERGQIDFSSGLGYLEMAPEANIENFLRAGIAWLCVKNEAVLLHSAGVIRDGIGYVFFGPSGSGKTTTSRISAKSADVVSDDLVIIRIEKDAINLYGVPFRGEMSDSPRANQSARLKAIFRLRQDTGHFLEPISQVVAVADLVASSPFVVQEKSLSDQLIELCTKIANYVPVMALHFKRDEGFWKVIDEHFEDVS